MSHGTSGRKICVDATLWSESSSSGRLAAIGCEISTGIRIGATHTTAVRGLIARRQSKKNLKKIEIFSQLTTSSDEGTHADTAPPRVRRSIR
jgi:hypothetical protein